MLTATVSQHLHSISPGNIVEMSGETYYHIHNPPH